MYRARDEDVQLAHWKYIDKWRENGKWKYRYKSDQKNTSSGGLLSNIKKAVSDTVSNISKTVSNTVSKISTSIGSAFTKVSDISKNVIDKGKNFVNNIVNKNSESKITTNPSKKYKYIAKVDLGNGKWRYFYDLKEYNNYLIGKKFIEPFIDKAKEEKKREEFSDKIIDIFNKNVPRPSNVDTAKKFIDASLKKFPNFVKDDFLNRNDLNDLSTEDNSTKGRRESWSESVIRKTDGKNEFDDLPKKKTETSVIYDLSQVNENYNPRNPNTSKNCAYCSIAYDLRRKGYDVEAIEEPSILTNMDIFDMYGQDWEDQFYKFNRGKDEKQKQIADIEKNLSNYGDGARGILNFTWVLGGGHAVNWENIDGEVYIIDSQNKTVTKLEDSKYFNQAYELSYVRTDNVDLSEELIRFVKYNDRD